MNKKALLLVMFFGLVGSQGVLAQETIDFLASPEVMSDPLPVVLFVPPRALEGARVELSELLFEKVLQVPETEYQIVTIDQLPDYEDYNAQIYFEACPAGQIRECLPVLASRGGAEYAVGIEVRPIDEKSIDVTLVIYDLRLGDDRISSVAVGHDDHGLFALQVVPDALRKMFERTRASEDMRSETLKEEIAIEDARLAAAETRTAAERELHSDQSEIDQAIGEGDREEALSLELTEADLEMSIDPDDALRPWDYMQLTKAEYLDYKNSGLNERDWRTRELGRARGVSFRLGGGVVFGPYGQQVDGRYALDPAVVGDDGGFGLVEARTQVSRASAISPMFELEAGYGVSENLEVGVAVGAIVGWTRAAYYQEIIGDVYEALVGSEEKNTLLNRVGIVVDWSLKPNAKFNPGAVVGVYRIGGVDATADTNPPSYVLPVDLPGFYSVMVAPSMDISLGGGLNLYSRLGIGYNLGERFFEVQSGQQALMTESAPSPAGAISAGLTVGIVHRFGPIGGVAEVGEDSLIGIE